MKKIFNNIQRMSCEYDELACVSVEAREFYAKNRNVMAVAVIGFSILYQRMMGKSLIVGESPSAEMIVMTPQIILVSGMLLGMYIIPLLAKSLTIGHFRRHRRSGKMADKKS